jgi:hypothetical protein
VRTKREGTIESRRPGESGVALRLPPLSKIVGALAGQLEFCGGVLESADIGEGDSCV